MSAPDRIEELIVPFDDSQLRARAQRRKRGMWSRVVSLGITVVVLALLYRYARSSESSILRSTWSLVTR